MEKNRVVVLLILLLFVLSGCSQNFSLSNQEGQPANTSTYPSIGSLTSTPTLESEDIKEREEIIYHKASGQILYDWYSYVPKSLNRKNDNYIWVTGLNGNFITDDYAEIVKESFNQISWRTESADINNLIIISPAIPRPETNYVYVVSIPSFVFSTETDPSLQRPDEQLNLMIDELTEDLQNDGIQMSSKIFIEGFSAGAMFAQRYTLLHPERVQAMVAGQCGGAITLPVAVYDSTILNWPVGINDFFELTGEEFDLETYRKVPQLIYIGDKDNNNSTLWGTGELWITQEQIDFLNHTFGDTDPIRLQNEVDYLRKNGFTNIEYILYKDVAHELTESSINQTFYFIKQHR